MQKKFKVGEYVEWNSETGKVEGTIKQKLLLKFNLIGILFMRPKMNLST